MMRIAVSLLAVAALTTAQFDEDYYYTAYPDGDLAVLASANTSTVFSEYPRLRLDSTGRLRRGSVTTREMTASSVLGISFWNLFTSALTFVGQTTPSNTLIPHGVATVRNPAKCFGADGETTTSRHAKYCDFSFYVTGVNQGLQLELSVRRRLVTGMYTDGKHYFRTASGFVGTCVTEPAPGYNVTVGSEIIKEDGSLEEALLVPDNVQSVSQCTTVTRTPGTFVMDWMLRQRAAGSGITAQRSWTGMRWLVDISQFLSKQVWYLPTGGSGWEAYNVDTQLGTQRNVSALRLCIEDTCYTATVNEKYNHFNQTAFNNNLMESTITAKTNHIATFNGTHLTIQYPDFDTRSGPNGEYIVHGVSVSHESSAWKAIPVLASLLCALIVTLL